MSTTVEIELVPERVSSEEEWLLGTFEELRLKPEHTIFLSHSGAQKNFVEQLCEDLERVKLTPFFDKRSDSLPKGEEFPQLIFKAAQQCELAIVVVSEEYFSRSKWPMLELCTFVQSSKCKILPLFFGLSCKEFGNLERRESWFQIWDTWAQANPRIRVDDWKNALQEVDRRNGLEYLDALGEVVYRKVVVETVSKIMQKSLQDEVQNSTFFSVQFIGLRADFHAPTKSAKALPTLLKSPSFAEYTGTWKSVLRGCNDRMLDLVWFSEF